MNNDIRSDEATAEFRPNRDEDLMELVVLGQGEAFKELVRRYENRFLATAYRAISDHDSAEDITQETFTAIWNDRHRFNKNIAKFSTWAYIILRQQIDKYLRDSRKTRRMVSLSAVEEDKDILAILSGPAPTGASGRETWFEGLSESRLAQLKEIVLRYLSQEEQQLYHLKKEEGLSYEAISRLPPFKGVKVATLKKRRQRYKDKIIEVLEMEKPR